MKKIAIFIIFTFFYNIQSYNVNHVRQLALTGECPNCDLTNAFLQGLKLLNSNLSGANLSGASFSGAVMPNASFKGAKLINTIFDQCTMKNSNFTKADCSGAKFHNTYLIDANFTDANLTGVNFAFTRLPGAIFNRAKVQNMLFLQSDLYKANFINSIGKFTHDYCGYDGANNCPPGPVPCSYFCTGFCCTTMKDGSIKTDPLSSFCSVDRRADCK